MELKWPNSFSPPNASRMEAKLGYVKPNTQTPCRPTFNAKWGMRNYLDPCECLVN